MGCDIHFLLERRDGNDWVSCDEWTTDPLPWDPDFQVPTTRFYSDRNFDMFAILANVRNGYGTAGLDTGDGFNVIAMPKGLPDDLSPEVQALAVYEIDDMGCHTPTWLTLSEILAFNWDQTTTNRGFVEGPDYAEWIGAQREQGLEPVHCAGIFRDGMRVLSEDEMRNAIDAIKRDNEVDTWAQKIKEELQDTYCHLSWELSYRVCAKNFIRYTVAHMKKLGKPEDVRCVFWFDS
jgi:hypothetical protein